MANEQSASATDQLTIDGEEADAEPQFPGSNDDEDHPEWGVTIRAYGPDDEPGESRWEHYYPRAPDKETAREKAIEEAQTPGINAIIGISDCYDVVEVTGPYDPEIVTDGGVDQSSGGTERCEWCRDAPGDAISGVAICDDCLDRYEIPPRTISGQMDEPVKVTDGGRPDDTERLHVDLGTGLGGWTAPFRDSPEWRSVGVDIRDDLEADVIGDIRQLPLDCSPDLLTMSPPCTEFARWMLPWLDEPNPDLSLVEACLDAVDELEPTWWVLENSRGLHQYWREADQNVGPFYLWGNLPPIEADVPHGKMQVSGERPEERAKIPYELADSVRREVEGQHKLVTDGGTVEDGIDRPEVDVDELEHDATETHSDPIEGEVTRDYYDCPNCGFPISEWMDCPECLWYDEDVWERTLSDGGVSA